MTWRRHIRACFFAARGRHDEAAAEYRRVLEFDPIDPPALITVLRDCRRDGRIAEAIAISNRALAVDPANFAALDGLAWAYLKQKDHHRAKPILEKAVAAFDALDAASAFGGMARVMIGAYRVVSRLPGFSGRLPRVPPTADIAAAGDRGLTTWRTWALDYLAWYGREYGPDSTNAQ